MSFVVSGSDLPWFFFINILVKSPYLLPNFIESPVKLTNFNGLGYGGGVVARRRRIANDAILILLDHHNCSLNSITEFVSQLVVVGCLESLPTKITIIVRWNVPQTVIPECIQPVFVDYLFWM